MASAASRRWRALLIVVAVVTVLQTPWLIYSGRNAPTAVERAAAHGGAIAYACSELLTLRVGGTVASGRASMRDLLARLARNVSNIAAKMSGRSSCRSSTAAQVKASRGGIDWFRRRVAGGQHGERAISMVLSSLLAVVALIGSGVCVRKGFTTAEALVAISAGMIALVPSWSFRYTLAPFVFLYTAALRPVELPTVSLGYQLRHLSTHRRLWVIEFTEP